MRMWNTPPKIMCRQHLLGEHLEMHMFAGCLTLHKTLAGYIANGIVDLRQIRARHDDLAEEMKRRGYAHKTPLPPFPEPQPPYGEVAVEKSLQELNRRCAECRKRGIDDQSRKD